MKDVSIMDSNEDVVNPQKPSPQQVKTCPNTTIDVIVPSIPSPVVNVPLGTVNDGSTSLPLCDYASLHQTAGNSIDPNNTITALGGNNIVNNFIYLRKGNEHDSDWDSFKKTQRIYFHITTPLYQTP